MSEKRPSIWARAWKDTLGAYRRKGPERILVPILGALAAVIAGTALADNLGRQILAGLGAAASLGVIVFLWHLLLAPGRVRDDLWGRVRGQSEAETDFERKYTSLMGDFVDLMSQVRLIENGKKDLKPRTITARWPEFIDVHTTLDDINTYSGYIATDIDAHKNAVPDLRHNAGKLREACKEAVEITRQIYRDRTGKATPKD